MLSGGQDGFGEGKWGSYDHISLYRRVKFSRKKKNTFLKIFQRNSAGTAFLSNGTKQYTFSKFNILLLHIQGYARW